MVRLCKVCLGLRLDIFRKNIMLIKILTHVYLGQNDADSYVYQPSSFVITVFFLKYRKEIYNIFLFLKIYVASPPVITSINTPKLE